MSYGVAASGGRTGKNKNKSRDPHDFDPTPWDVTLAFIRQERRFLSIDNSMWDPACGDGALVDVFKNQGFYCHATDLIARGAYPGGRDFLKERKLLSPAIITNPPFRLAREFIEHAHALRAPYIAMLLKSTYYHAYKRYGFFKQLPPSRIYPLSWRPDFRNLGNPTMEVSWFVWDSQSPYRRERGCYMPSLLRPVDISGFPTEENR